MSELMTAAKVSKEVREHIKQAEQLAQPGTHEHSMFLGAALLSKWSRIQFCLEVLEREARS